MKVSKQIKKHYSKLGKMSYKKHPHPRSHYVEMGRKGGNARKKSLSTEGVLPSQQSVDTI